MNHRHSLFAVLFAGILLMLGGCAAAPSSPAPAPATAAPKAAEAVQAAQVPERAGGHRMAAGVHVGGRRGGQGDSRYCSLACLRDRPLRRIGGCDWFVGLHILKAENGLQMEAPQKTREAVPRKRT